LAGLVFSVLAVSESAWAAKNFKDDDWTHSFYERCSSGGGFANGSEVKWMKEESTKFLRFTLADGQKGNCSRDKHRRKKGGAPHWERSEISSGTDTNSKFLLRSGGNYQINLRVRFVEGFSSDKESILQIYSECQWKGRCSPLLQLRSIGDYANPGYLRTEVLQKRGEKKKKRGNWNSASALDDYFQSRTYLTNDATAARFSPITHKGKWVNIIFHVSVTPKTVTLMSWLVAPAGVWTVPKQTIDRPSGMLDPHIEIGLYRPGSDTVPNPTSTIDFDYIKISTEQRSPFEAKFGKYSNKQVCAIAKTTNGLWNNQYEDERVWVREAKRRGLDCIDRKAFEAVATSSSDKKVCDKATAPHGDARKWLADLKSDEAIFHIWREEAESRGLSCNVINATTDPYQSYSDKQICTMVGALNGLAEQKLWIEEARQRGLSQCK